MRVQELHVGMKVKHPNHGVGTVKSISEQLAEIRFETGTHTVAPETSNLEPAGERVSVSGLDMSLSEFVKGIIEDTIDKLDIKEPETVVEDLGDRWRNGRFVLHPANPTLQTKEVPLETFFHKIVMMRNNLRVLEQKLNGHTGLSDAEKFDFQQYITRCYGSMTTFNLLFKDKDDGFQS